MNPTPDDPTPGSARGDAAAPVRLTVAGAAARLGVSPRTVRRRIERGELSGELAALDGGGRAWFVTLGESDNRPKDNRAARRADSVRTANGQRAATANGQRADSAANRSNEREKPRTDSVRPSERTACGQRADSERTATGEREPTRREREQQEEISFLRSTIEQLQRDGAEVRAALRAALKLAAPQSAPQLTAGDGIEAGAASGASTAGDASASSEARAPNHANAGRDGPPVAPDREPREQGKVTTAKQSSAAPLTYGDIADALERDLNARDVNPG